jgi:hypothetical protein
MFPHERIFFKARATKERVPLINAQVTRTIFFVRILNFFVLIH